MNIMRRKEKGSWYEENIAFSLSDWGPNDEDVDIFIDWAEISKHTNPPHESPWTEVEWGKVQVVQNGVLTTVTLTPEQDKRIEEKLYAYADLE